MDTLIGGFVFVFAFTVTAILFMNIVERYFPVWGDNTHAEKQETQKRNKTWIEEVHKEKAKSFGSGNGRKTQSAKFSNHPEQGGDE